MNAYRRVVRTIVIIDLIASIVCLILAFIFLIAAVSEKSNWYAVIIFSIIGVIDGLISFGTLRAIDNYGCIPLWAILNFLFVWFVPGILLAVLGWMDRYQSREPAIRTIEKQNTAYRSTVTYQPKPIQKEKVETSAEQAKIDAIKQYKQLMDDGVITKQDFERKKQELLKTSEEIEPESEAVLEEPKEKVVDDSNDQIYLNDKVIILNDVFIGNKSFKANRVGMVDNILISTSGKSYVVILDNDPDKTEINLRRQEIKKIK